MKKAVLTILFSVTAIAGVIAWMMFPDKDVDLREILMIIVVSIVIIFGLFIGISRLRDARKNLPLEDERSRRIMQRSGATSFYISLYMWMIIMFFYEKITLEIPTLIGLGILGMSVLFALSWIYHNYLSGKHD